jgi:hypothetical protein
MQGFAREIALRQNSGAKSDFRPYPSGVNSYLKDSSQTAAIGKIKLMNGGELHSA